MAIIQCPQCQGRMRFPDESEPKKVRCPTCGNSFTGSNPDNPSRSTTPSTTPGNRRAEEDEDDHPKKKSTRRNEEDEEDDDKPKRKSRSSSEDDDDDRPRKKSSSREEDESPSRRSRARDDDEDRPRKSKSKADIEEDFEVVDDDRPKRKRRGDEDDDDDRPRSKKRRGDEDDDDDRPRSKKRRGDEDDDRPRAKKGRFRDDEDDDDDDRPKATAKGTLGQYANARTGTNLMAIGLWCMVASLGLELLLRLIQSLDYTLGLSDLYAIPGIIGIVHWVVSAVGIGFMVAGPKRGNLLGLTISLASVAFIHLALLIYMLTNKGSGAFAIAGESWTLLITPLHITVFMVLDGVFFVVPLFAGLFEIARFILMFLTWKELCRVCKNRDAEGKSMTLVIAYPSGWAIVIVLLLIMRVIARNASLGSEARVLAVVVVILLFGVIIALKSWAAVIAGEVRDGVRRV